MCCLFYNKVRTGLVLVFGYINAVITGFGVFCLLCEMAVMTTQSLINDGYHTRHDINFPNSLNDSYAADANWSYINLSVCFVEVTSAFTCTVLLLFGIHENKPALVKTYLIYGMIQLIILIGLMITLFIATVPVAGIKVLLGCCIYLLIEYMVYLTYKGMITPEKNSYFLNPSNIVKPKLEFYSR